MTPFTRNMLQCLNDNALFDIRAKYLFILKYTVHLYDLLFQHISRFLNFICVGLGFLALSPNLDMQSVAFLIRFRIMY